MNKKVDIPLEDLLDSAPDGFVVVDCSGTIVYVNRTAEELFGYGPGELAGMQLSVLIPERLREVHRQHRLDYQKDPRVRPMGLGLDLVGRCRDGSEIPIEISLSPLEKGEEVFFTAVVRDVQERQRLEQERNALALELETERERDRIAMDLHDGILQDIYASALALELAALGDGNDPEAIGRVVDRLHGVVRDVRSYIFDLRPREFSGDLSEAIGSLAQEFSQNSQIQTSTEIEDGGAAADLATSMAVYNIAHECLSNIQRHSQATHVWIGLRFDGDSGQLEVVDDGVGFDPGAAQSGTHRGLRNMQSRAREVNAELNLESAKNRGTRLSVRFPARRD